MRQLPNPSTAPRPKSAPPTGNGPAPRNSTTALQKMKPKTGQQTSKASTNSTEKQAFQKKPALPTFPFKKKAQSIPRITDYSYMRPNHKKGPAFSFGARVEVKHPISPGPGTYNHNTEVRNSPAWSFFHRLKEGKTGTDAPGPGSYAVSKPMLRENKGYIGVRVKYEQKGNSPGPGEYNVHSAEVTYKGHGRGVAYSLSGRATNKICSSAPGPGAYHTAGNALREKGTQTYYMNAKDQRFKMLKEKTPGPGEYYRLSDVIGNSPAFSMGSRILSKQKPPETPGPGAYVRANSAPSQKINALGTEQRFKALVISSKNNLMVRKSASDMSPGPGAYAVSGALVQDEKGISIGARTPILNSCTGTDSPGPAAYFRLPGTDNH